MTDVNHLQASKDGIDILYSDITEKGVEVAKAHALIAIAEQLKRMNAKPEEGEECDHDYTDELIVNRCRNCNEDVEWSSSAGAWLLQEDK